MTNSKRVLTVIGITIAVIVGLFGVALLIISRNINTPDDVYDSYDQQIEMSINSFPTDLVIYGDDCRLRKKAVYRQVDSISDETLGSSGSYRFKVLIINDINDNADLTDDDFEVLRKYVIDGEYHFYYFGTRYLEEFYEKEFLKLELQPESCGFGIRHVADRTSFVVNEGMWTTEDYATYENNSDYLGQVIYMYLKRIYSDNA